MITAGMVLGLWKNSSDRSGSVPGPRRTSRNFCTQVPIGVDSKIGGYSEEKHTHTLGIIRNLKFPNMVVLNGVGCRNSQKSANERKRPQKIFVLATSYLGIGNGVGRQGRGNQTPYRRYGPDAEIQHRLREPHGLTKTSRLLSKREADKEFQYRPHIVDTDTDCGRHFCGRYFRESYPRSPRRRKVESSQRIAKGAGGKGPRQKTSKIVKKCQKVFRHFSTTFARHYFSGPFWGALK